MRFQYFSEVPRNEIVLVIKLNDIVGDQIYKNGSIDLEAGTTREGWHYYVLKRPENGLYFIHIYTKKAIENTKKMIEINY